MSGIFGIMCRTGDGNSAVQDIKKILVWNQAYGREGEDLYIEGSAAVGCCLEKLDSEALRSRPVLKEEKRAVVIDALLYNSQEISEKCGLQERLPDEELLLRYMDEFGLNSLEDVNGDFCGCIYKEQEHSLTLFRDHMGVRPLFYYASQDCVVFSTDIRGLLALDWVDASVNEDWLYRLCCGFYMDGLKWTEYQHIYCVKPASYITFSFQNEKMKIDEREYWRLGSQKMRLSSFDEYKNRLKELVTDSIKRRLDAVSGRVGAELSGGLDSGVIDILIHRLGRECLYHSWSVAPEQVPYAENDERLIIADICRQEQISCHFRDMHLDFGKGCGLAQNMQGMGLPLDEIESPVLRYAMPPYINTLSPSVTSEYMKQNGVRTVFSGHGGDEGVSHRCNVYELCYYHEYYQFFRQIWLNMHGRKRRLIKTIRKGCRIWKRDRRLFSKPFHGVFDVREIVSRQLAEKYHEEDMPVLHFAFSPVDYIKEGGSRNRLDNVALMGAYNGVRYLMPYLDYRVIDFAVSIPRHLYLNGSENRYLFREAFKELMPESLYRLRIKAENSVKNYQKKPGWEVQYEQEKASIVQKLERDFWKNYLNFDVIDAWLKKSGTSAEEEYHDYCIFKCLCSCAMAQNLTEKAKLAVQDLERPKV